MKTSGPADKCSNLSAAWRWQNSVLHYLKQVHTWCHKKMLNKFPKPKRYCPKQGINFLGTTQKPSHRRLVRKARFSQQKEINKKLSPKIKQHFIGTENENRVGSFVAKTTEMLHSANIAILVTPWNAITKIKTNASTNFQHLADHSLWLLKMKFKLIASF